jgi:LmbE family N-acetylglucosaminyl deacetylase
MKNKNIVLVVAAHPDDEVLGCGGTIARLVKEECEAFTLILGEGITSRDEKRDRERREKEIEKLRKQMHEANQILGVKKVFIHNFPDNRFDTVPLLDIVKVIEKVKKQVKPNIVFTHYEHDLNIDHQLTFKAVLTATRPVKGEPVREIYSFETPSSTEWSYPLNFSPSVFFDISHTINIKLKALAKYKMELKEYPHPRSLEGIKLISQYWGMKVALSYAEAFEPVRIIRQDKSNLEK